jgi:hypothetical protein
VMATCCENARAEHCDHEGSPAHPLSLLGPPNTRDQLRGAHDLAPVHDDPADVVLPLASNRPSSAASRCYPAPLPEASGEAVVGLVI